MVADPCHLWNGCHQECRGPWVSPDLHILEAEAWERAGFGDDVTQVDADGERRAYRRLTKAWFVWLLDHRERIQDHMAAGTIDRARGAAFLARWPRVLFEASRNLSHEAYTQALQAKPHYGYTHPIPRPPQGQPASQPTAIGA